MKKMIMIEVSAREANVLTHYAMKFAANNIRESNGWRAASQVLNEASKAVYFPVEGSDEENELRQQGVEVKRGMAFMEPQSALQMMQSMAQDNSAFKDVPTITSLVRKIAARLGTKMPKILGGQGEQGAGHTPVSSMGSGVEGAEKAKYAETQPMPDLQSPEEFERMQQHMYAPTSTAHNLTPSAPPEGEALTPVPGTMGTFQPRVRPPPPELPGEDVNVSNWASEVDQPNTFMSDVQNAEQAAKSGQMARSTLHDSSKDIKQSGKSVDPGAADVNLRGLFDDEDLKEAYSLLGIRAPRWRNKDV